MKEIASTFPSTCNATDALVNEFPLIITLPAASISYPTVGVNVNNPILLDPPSIKKASWNCPETFVVLKLIFPSLVAFSINKFSPTIRMLASLL